MTRTDAKLTDRLIFTYNDGEFDHSTQWRFMSVATTESEVMDAIHDYMSAIAPEMYLVSVVTVERIVVGSNVRNPITWSHASTYGSTSMPVVSAPRYIEYTGKDREGHRWHLTQFGIKVGTPPTWEFAPGDNSDLDAGRLALNASFLGGIIVSVVGLKVSMNGNIPIGYNDHFIKRERP